MKIIFFLFFSGVAFSSIGQAYNADKINKKAIDLYERALQKLQNDQLKESIPLLQQAIERDKNYVDAILSLASVYGELKDYKTSAEYFEKSKAIDTAYFRFFNLPYSINLAGLGRFNDALNAINQFLNIAELSDRSRKSGEFRKRTYEFGIQYANKNPVGDYVFAP